MSTKKVTVHAAKTHLSRILAEIEKGSEFEITRRGESVARLTQSKKSRKKRAQVGIATSPPIAVADEVFEPLSEGELKLWGLH